MAETPVAVAASSALKLRKVAAWRGIRVLAWDGEVLYGCRGYQIVEGCTIGDETQNGKMSRAFVPSGGGISRRAARSAIA